MGVTPTIVGSVADAIVAGILRAYSSVIPDILTKGILALILDIVGNEFFTVIVDNLFFCHGSILV